MDILSRSKINFLMANWPNHTVAVTNYFQDLDISNQLLAIYKKNKWVKSIGRGAYIKYNDKLHYQGAIYALQKHELMTVHPGAKTALSLLGKTHYLEFQTKQVYLFGSTKERLPSWVDKNEWHIELKFNQTSFMPPTLGLIEYNVGEYTIMISDTVRAFLECLLLAPKDQDILECFEILEGLNDLRPDKVNEYLRQCSSIKVKRLFLYLAEKSGHQWFQHINAESLDLGNGNRSLAEDGMYSSKYKITIPKTFKEHGKLVV
ncbi:MAG: type IV toxin-antitoxin system AbiEi family antitoxin domain-containing protein [Saprospiraceae bacterium]|jgi:hypothetical protein